MDSFPVVLLLGLFLALSTLSLGLVGMERLREREGKEKAVLGLQLFLREVKALALSSPGSGREVELELGEGELLVLEGKVELWFRGKKAGEGIPALPLHPHPLLLREGRYLLRLERGEDFRVLVLPVSGS
ncbi:MAG: hypothetical protein QXM46_02455 [Candidatus Hadarchaeales archaeon]